MVVISQKTQHIKTKMPKFKKFSLAELSNLKSNLKPSPYRDLTD